MPWLGLPNEVSAATIKTAFHIDVVHFLSHDGIWMESASLHSYGLF